MGVIMTCSFKNICGGCQYKSSDKKSYQAEKIAAFKNIIKDLGFIIDEPYFVDEGSRRRATFAYSCSCHPQGQPPRELAHRGSKTGCAATPAFGFNHEKSKEIVDINFCELLTDKINKNIGNLKELAAELKLKKADIYVADLDNGLDVVLEFDESLSLDHRMIIAELAQRFNDIIRISHRKSAFGQTETVLEKLKPSTKIAGFEVFIPAGGFLQPSKASEQKLIELVQKYISDTKGNIADLFCGIGTFSYPLCLTHKVISIDSAPDLLEAFKTSVAKNQIHNIEIKQKNLFKYPLDASDLKNINIVVLDPPRAGAKEQASMLAAGNVEKIIYVSCNPQTFIRDAQILKQGGYQEKNITLVDQFRNSTHMELVAVFVK